MLLLLLITVEGISSKSIFQTKFSNGKWRGKASQSFLNDDVTDTRFSGSTSQPHLDDGLGLEAEPDLSVSKSDSQVVNKE